jgi:hypothetical protein
MVALSSRLRLLGLIVTAILVGTGCNPFLLPYLLGGDSSQKAIMQNLAQKDRPVKVVVLAYAASANNNAETVGVDRELSSRLARHILENCKTNREQIDIIPPRLVEKFKEDHSDWHTLDLHVIGDYFKAEYVIYLEIGSFSLYEGDRLMYRGRADIHFQLHDMSQPDEEPQKDDYTVEYPKGFPKPVEDTNLQAFRNDFLDYTARHLAWYFTAHSQTTEYGME